MPLTAKAWEKLQQDIDLYQNKFLEFAKTLKLDETTLPTSVTGNSSARLVLIEELLESLKDYDAHIETIKIPQRLLPTYIAGMHIYLHEVKASLETLLEQDLQLIQFEKALENLKDGLDSLRVLSLKIEEYLIKLQPCFDKAKELQNEKELLVHLDTVEQETSRPFDKGEQTNTASIVGAVKKQLKTKAGGASP